MSRQILVSLDVFSYIWSARLPHEASEDEILSRLLKIPAAAPAKEKARPAPISSVKVSSKPHSKSWTDVLIWTLHQYGGKATLAEIYKTSREGRLALGVAITAEHDASARECLESHCSDSHKYRGKADLFYMPQGKGAGVWALRK